MCWLLWSLLCPDIWEKHFQESMFCLGFYLRGAESMAGLTAPGLLYLGHWSVGRCCLHFLDKAGRPRTYEEVPSQTPHGCSRGFWIQPSCRWSENHLRSGFSSHWRFPCDPELEHSPVTVLGTLDTILLKLSLNFDKKRFFSSMCHLSCHLTSWSRVLMARPNGAPLHRST